MDRVVTQLPIIGGGVIAVVANAEVNAESWAYLVQTVQLQAGAFEKRATKKAATDALTVASELPADTPPDSALTERVPA